MIKINNNNITVTQLFPNGQDRPVKIRAHSIIRCYPYENTTGIVSTGWYASGEQWFIQIHCLETIEEIDAMLEKEGLERSGVVIETKVMQPKGVKVK